MENTVLKQQPYKSITTWISTVYSVANLVSLFMQINQTGKRIFWKKSFEFQITNMWLSMVLFSFQLPVTEKTWHLLWLSCWIIMPSQLTHHSFDALVLVQPMEMVWDVLVLFATSLPEMINPLELEKGSLCPMPKSRQYKSRCLSLKHIYWQLQSKPQFISGTSAELAQVSKIAEGQIWDFHRLYLNSLQ